MLKSIPKSNINECKIRVRKSDAKMMDIYPKWMPKGDPKATKRQTNVDPEIGRKKIQKSFLNRPGPINQKTY